MTSTTFPPPFFLSLRVIAMVCLQDVEQELLGQTASPDAAASTVVAVTSGLGLATVLLASLEPTATQVSQETLHLFVLVNHCGGPPCTPLLPLLRVAVVLGNSGQPQLRQPAKSIK